jgi:tRNA threonylcarbamoyladenosine biosynthesis protein TsaE
MTAGRTTTTTNSADETLALGRLLGRCLEPGDVVALVGPLGAGKTCLVKGVVAGMGLRDTRRVVSPTYLLIKEYEARLHAYHVDAYRLNTASELLDLGFDEMCATGGVILIEWADRIAAALPDDHVLITLQPTAETQRDLIFEARGPRAAALLRRFEQL